MVSHPIDGWCRDKYARGHCLRSWSVGCAPRSENCRLSRLRRPRSSTPSTCGRHCCSTATMVSIKIDNLAAKRALCGVAYDFCNS